MVRIAINEPHSETVGADGRLAGLTEREFEEWIESIAAVEDSSKDRVRGRLVSSFRLLEELDAASETTVVDWDTESDESDQPKQTANESTQRREDATQARADPAGQPDSETRSDPSPQRMPDLETVLELIAALDEFGRSDAPESTGPDGDSTELARQVRALEGDVTDAAIDLEVNDRLSNERLARVETRLNDLEERGEQAIQPGQLETVAQAFEARIEALDSTVDSLDSRVETEVSQLQAGLSEHREAFAAVLNLVKALAARLEEVGELGAKQDELVAALKRQVSTHDQQLTSLDSAITTQAEALAELRSGVSTHETELEHVETIFGHLFDEVATAGGQLEAVVASLRELEPVITAHHERERVEDIKTAAARRGRSQASCESCGETVDLSLLDRPNCPHCRVPIVDLNVRSGWFRTKTVLETGEPVSETVEWGTDLPAVDAPTKQGAAASTFRFVGDT